MKDYIEERAITIANYIIDHNATVRQTAKAFGVSKSTVHKDVTDRLVQINPALASLNAISGADLLPEKNICISITIDKREQSLCHETYAPLFLLCGNFCH